MGIVIAIAWLVVAFIIAGAAREKGRSYAGYLILGLLLSPIVSGLVLPAARRRRPEKLLAEVLLVLPLFLWKHN